VPLWKNQVSLWLTRGWGQRWRAHLQREHPAAEAELMKADASTTAGSQRTWAETNLNMIIVCVF